jgi:hypothetical protein
MTFGAHSRPSPLLLAHSIELEQQRPEIEYEFELEDEYD